MTCETPQETARASTAARASAAATAYCSDGPLHLFQYAQRAACLYTGDGWDLTLQGRGAWYDMGSFQNSASAYFMGEHSGHMSDLYGGGGDWVPYSTGVGDYKLSLNGTSWSNRISSRYRN